MPSETSHSRRGPAVWLAVGFGLGYSPFASGTAGTLLGIPLAMLIARVPDGVVGMCIQATIAVALSVIAIPICDRAEKHFGRKDDGRIVADEYLTFPICMLGLPMHPAMILVAFLTNRFFDIVKPPPARGLQRLKGGVGIVIDDFIAVLYSLAFNHALYWFVLRRFL